jgi:D-apiose dehydrogenase
VIETRIAMVGAGYFAQFQLEGWRDAGAPVVALCDLDAARAHALALRHGGPRCFMAAADMLDAMHPALVDVVLPPHAQAAVVRAALERCIPTICQKPFGADLAEAEALTAFAEAQRTPLVVHENFRFTPWFRECRQRFG